jgi:hypothetical protein
MLRAENPKEIANLHHSPQHLHNFWANQGKKSEVIYE